MLGRIEKCIVLLCSMQTEEKKGGGGEAHSHKNTSLCTKLTRMTRLKRRRPWFQMNKLLSIYACNARPLICQLCRALSSCCAVHSQRGRYQRVTENVPFWESWTLVYGRYSVQIPQQYSTLPCHSMGREAVSADETKPTQTYTTVYPIIKIIHLPEYQLDFWREAACAFGPDAAT